MIYFLARSVAEPDGGSRAGADILQDMLAPNRSVTVICEDRCWVPHEVDGQPIPSPRWLVRPPTRGTESLRFSPRGLARYSLSRLTMLRVRYALWGRPPALAVHNGFPIPGSINTVVLERSPRRLIVVHSSPEALGFFARGRPGWTREWVGEKLRQAQGLMFVTPQIRDAWSDLAGLEGIPSFVVPNTTREDEARRVLALSKDDVRRDLGLSTDAFVVSCVAKVDISKGQDVLVKALPKMVAAVPNLHVVFVGPMTPYGEHLPDEIETMGLKQHVSFAGRRDDSYSYIRASDMLVLPSRAEGQGMVVLEAMVLRTPVLASRVGGIPFSVEHSRSGWLVAPDDPAALADAFETLARDSSLRVELARAAEGRYWQEFSRMRHRSRVQEAIESVLGIGNTTSWQESR